jgi:hypothetical protein
VFSEIFIYLVVVGIPVDVTKGLFAQAA